MIVELEERVAPSKHREATWKVLSLFVNKGGVILALACTSMRHLDAADMACLRGTVALICCAPIGSVVFAAEAALLPVRLQEGHAGKKVWR